jgi:hypothetical protein
MTARLSAQEKAEIPLALRSPITLQEAQEISQPILTAPPGVATRNAIESTIKATKDKYGDKWEQAFDFAMRAQKVSAGVAESVATTLRRASIATTPDRAVNNAIIETENATRAIAPIMPSLSDGSPVTIPQNFEPVPVRPVPTERVPMSKKILDKLPEYGRQ